MANVVCPYCGHDRSGGAIVKGAGIGAGIAIATLVNPILGGIAAAGVAVTKLVTSDTKIVTCPNPDCGREYSL